MKPKRSTGGGGIPPVDDPVPVKQHRRRVRVGRMVRAYVELARSRRRLAHVPTLLQVRALAHFDGREPSSYVLDPAVNLVPSCRSAATTRRAGTRCASPANARRAGDQSSW